MRIDIFCHILPKPYFDRMVTQKTSESIFLQKRVSRIPILVDLDERFRVMDRFAPYSQILSIPAPPIEDLGGPNETPELARLANDSMAELCARYPDRFPGFIASLPLNHPEASLEETKRAVDQLGARGIQFFTNVNGKPLDLPEFEPLFAAMAGRDLPIWIHPHRTATFADYATEKTSEYEMWWVFGWPYETSIAMARIVFAGIFDRHPNVKIITHHGGGMVPHFSGRIGPGLDQLGARTPEGEGMGKVRHSLKRRPFDYFKMFYADTAMFGSVHATRCALEFFGVEHMLFASDMPFDPEKGPGYIRETIAVLDALALDPTTRKSIDEGNARRLLHLK